MVNREKRDTARALIRGLASGDLTNEDFENEYPRDSTDRALRAIYQRLWFYWDDLKTHKLTDRYALSEDAAKLFSRSSAFLATDLEYEWPSVGPSALLIVLRILGLRAAAKSRERHELEQLYSLGDFDSWPFLRTLESDQTKP